MYVTKEILLDALDAKWKILHYGQEMNHQFLSLPAFYTENTTLIPNKVYIVRTEGLPPLPTEKCLFICVGSRPVNLFSDWMGEIFHVADCTVDLISVFNLVQSVFDKINLWETQMQQLLEENADLEEMLRISIPIFNNRITIIDFELRIIAYCEASQINGYKEIRLNKSFDRVPREKTQMFDQIYAKRIQERKPYIFEENGTDNYCINLYLGEIYMGCCSLMEDARPIHAGDYILFQRFADYICRALRTQSHAPASQFATLNTIFSELLQNLPVSRDDLNHALSLASKNSAELPDRRPYWLCIVTRSANKTKSLPENYLCASFEKLLPACSAIVHNGMLVAFCQYSKMNIDIDDFSQTLLPFLRDMNFRAGISIPFDEIFKAKSYFLQARTALQFGIETHPEQFYFTFQDYAPTYMLQHSSGEFEPEVIFPPGLVQLINRKGGTDYFDTLKHYLDNECNASRTAAEMFLHRSTLIPRLDKIKTYVDLDTAQQRLYLRMCIYIYEMQHQI